MQALSLSRPQTLDLIDIPEPPRPGPGEALVAVRAIGICGTDISGYLGKMPFIQCPRILGHELGVEVLAAGPGVLHLQPGDRCSVEPYLNCGACHPCLEQKTNCCETLEVLGVHRDGGMCEQLLLPAHKLHPSSQLSFEQLALIETLAIGCHAVDRAALRPADDVLILGAGPIGLSVLEFARLQSRPIAVADPDPVRQDFLRQTYPEVTVLDLSLPTPPAQVVFDATGNPSSMARAVSCARFTGRIIYVGITKDPVPLDDALFHRRELTLCASRNALSADFGRIIDWVGRGVIQTRPWITHRGALNELPRLLPAWIRPGSGLVKAVVTLR